MINRLNALPKALAVAKVAKYILERDDFSFESLSESTQKILLETYNEDFGEKVNLNIARNRILSCIV